MEEALTAAPVLIPCIAALALALLVVRRRLEAGVPPLALPLDGKFLLGLAYTGALLTIYLSCYYFFFRLPAK
ncbi:MAG: hypothetical protein H6509_07345 [Bryobacterales bacterium]|nr:hypothetical protein [Acidobacteriota bacterium]MCB9384414.1 hypothetical protein [Bryobacterales bacterium]